MSVSLTGQEKLKNSSILIVGAGGLGCPAAIYLAAAGVGELHANNICIVFCLFLFKGLRFCLVFSI